MSTRADKVAEARRLRAQGLSHRAIANHMGETRRHVGAWLATNTCQCGEPCDRKRTRCRACATTDRAREAKSAALLNNAQRVAESERIITNKVCEHCGGPFVTDTTFQRYCTRVCRSRAERLRNPPPKQIEGGSLNAYSVTCSYRNASNERLTVVGWGKTKSAARAHADSQCPVERGPWELLAVSTPASIYRDLLRSA